MFHCILYMFFWKESTWFVIFTNQSTPLIFSNGKKQGMGIMGWILIKTLTYSPPQRKSTSTLNPPPVVRRSHGHFGLGDPKGLESHGELAPHHSPSQFGNPTTPKGPGTEIWSYLHGNSINTFRKSCCCWMPGMPGNLLNSESNIWSSRPIVYYICSCTWMRPKSFCKISPAWVGPGDQFR